MDQGLTGTHHLVLRRDIAEMSRVNRFIADVAQRSGWPATLIFPLQLCLEEAISNVIRHGVMRGGDSEIRVSLGERNDHVVACVEDEGEAFDPTQFAPPPRPASLADIPVGGMGIHLMRKFTARLAYARIGSRNRLVLEFGKDAQTAPGQNA